jgi:TraM recognition site of TraD and TraG
MLKLVNRKGQLKSALVFDEFPTIFVNQMDSLIATARSNLVAATLAVQDFSQLRKDYGKEQAEVIMNVCGNIISGQVLGDTAKTLSDRIGRIMQQRESVSINSNDTSLSKSTQLEAAIPPSRISSLSAGEFVGAVADDPQQKIRLKAFHCEIINDIEAIRKEEAAYEEIPVIRQVTPDIVQQNYYRIKADIRNLVDGEMQKIKSSPQYRHLLDKKKPRPKGPASH